MHKREPGWFTQQAWQLLLQQIFHEATQRTAGAWSVHERWTYDHERQAVRLSFTGQPMRACLRLVVRGWIRTGVFDDRFVFTVGCGTECNGRRNVHDPGDAQLQRNVEEGACALYICLLELLRVDHAQVVDRRDVVGQAAAFQALAQRRAIRDIARNELGSECLQRRSFLGGTDQTTKLCPTSSQAFCQSRSNEAGCTRKKNRCFPHSTGPCAVQPIPIGSPSISDSSFATMTSTSRFRSRPAWLT